jgi:hypothetical protein
MPYLHWEFDRQRELFASEIINITQSYWEKQAADDKVSRSIRVAKRIGLQRTGLFKKEPKKLDADDGPRYILFLKNIKSYLRPNGKTDSLQESIYSDGDSRLNRTGLHQIQSQPTGFGSVVAQKWNRVPSKLPTDRNGRITIAIPLGQYLLDAARLYETIRNYRDRKMMHKYLYHEPPLHPRRTLDQAYYWTLKTTGARDRDQVVYRGTAAKRENFHAFEGNEFPKHDELEIVGNCSHCTENIKKTSRVVMVEQLWMW